MGHGQKASGTAPAQEATGVGPHTIKENTRPDHQVLATRQHHGECTDKIKQQILAPGGDVQTARDAGATRGKSKAAIKIISYLAKKKTGGRGRWSQTPRVNTNGDSAAVYIALSKNYVSGSQAVWYGE